MGQLIIGAVVSFVIRSVASLVHEHGAGTLFMPLHFIGSFSDDIIALDARFEFSWDDRSYPARLASCVQETHEIAGMQTLVGVINIIAETAITDHLHAAVHLVAGAAVRKI